MIAGLCLDVHFVSPSPVLSPGIAGLQPGSRSHAGAWRSQEKLWGTGGVFMKQTSSPDYSSACKLIEEHISGAKRSLKTTVSQARHTPQTRWSDHPDAVQSVWGTRSDAMLSSQPSWASLSH